MSTFKRKSSSKLTINDMQSLALSKGGACLSDTYINATTKLIWQCKIGHKWQATRNSIQQGSWCPSCSRDRAGASQRGSLQEAKLLAKSRGGECLSTDYKNSMQKLLWKCAEGHTWLTTISSIKKGSWCSICSQGVSERICRTVFENGFEKAFPKARPDWLTNIRGNAMELDGFCEELGLAFEYNGRQHYIAAEFFHRTDPSLEKRIKDDKHKLELCHKHNVRLIVIPYTTGIDGIADFVFQASKDMGFNLSRDKFTWRSEDVYHSRSRLIDLMKVIASGHGGECISYSYINMNTKLRWRCAVGHEWEAVPSSVQQGVWCPQCGRKNAADVQRESIEEMRELAKLRDGQCISKEYINSQHRLRWKCVNNHEWDALPNTIKQGHWCPICAKSGSSAKKTIDEFRLLAQKNGGECLSSEYLGIHKKLKWRCKEGHEWEAMPSSIQKGMWCSVCGRAKVGNQLRKTLEDMQILAKKNNGICLSSEYLNAKSKLNWRCIKGHEWEATPDRIAQGSWCPTCSRIEGWKKRRKLSVS